jgi:6-phosphogluconolactonase (cycloisomerase 2 family)
MAIKWFNDFKYNISSAIAATLYGEFGAVGNVSASGTANSYATNGYSSNGLDNSITFTSSGNNMFYSQKNNIYSGNSSYMCLGFNIAEYNYQYAGYIQSTQSGLGVGAQYSSAISPNNMWLVVSGASNLTVYKNSGTGTYTHSSTISPTNGQVRSVAFNALGNLLLVGSGSGEAQNITSYPVSSSGIGATGTLVANLSANSDYICSDPANYYIGVAMDQGAGAAIYAYNFSTQTYSSTNLISSLAPATSARAIAWSPNGQYMACAGGSATINLYVNNYSGTFTRTTVTTTSPATSIWGLAWSPDSQWLAVASSTSSHFITLYKNNNDGTFTNVTTITQPAGSLYDCHFSADGNYLIGVGTSSPYITVWQNVGGTWSIVSFPSLSSAVSSTECGPILSLNDKTILVPISTSNGNVYVFSLENKIVLLSNSTTTATNTAAVPPSSSLLVTMTFDTINFYYTNSTGGVTATSVPLVNIGLSNTLYNCYMEIEINSTVANLWINNTMVLQISDPDLIHFLSQSVTATFYNYGISSGAATNNSYITNMYLIDGTGLFNTSRLGPVTMDTYYPTSDNTVAWTTSSGTTHYTLVDENPPDGDTSYVYTATLNTTDVLNFATQTTPTTVYASSIKAIARTISGGGEAGGLSLASDGTALTSYIIGSSYALYAQYADDPALNTTVTYEFVP